MHVWAPPWFTCTSRQRLQLPTLASRPSSTDPDCARFRSGWMPLPPELCLPEGRAVAMGLAAPQPPSGSRRSGSSC